MSLGLFLVDAMRYFFIDVSTTDFKGKETAVMKCFFFLFVFFHSDLVSNKRLKKSCLPLLLPG